MFKKTSGVVLSWVNLILNGKRTYEQVPKLGNLREMVKLVLNEVDA